MIVAVVLSATAAAAPASAPAPASAVADACSPTAPTPAAILCHVNAERARQHLAPLRANPQLARAEQRFAEALGPSAPLTHQLEGGAPPLMRLTASGYRGGRHGKSFDFIEILGRSSGAAATPAQRVRTWMKAPAIRRALVAKRFEDLGVGASTSGTTTIYVVVVAGPLKATTAPAPRR